MKRRLLLLCLSGLSLIGATGCWNPINQGFVAGLEDGLSAATAAAIEEWAASFFSGLNPGDGS